MVGVSAGRHGDRAWPPPTAFSPYCARSGAPCRGGPQKWRGLGELGVVPCQFGSKQFFGPGWCWDLMGRGERCWLFSLYVEGEGKSAICTRQAGGLPMETTRTDRTIFFIIKIHYEEQT